MIVKKRSFKSPLDICIHSDKKEELKSVLSPYQRGGQEVDSECSLFSLSFSPGLTCSNLMLQLLLAH